MAGNTRFTRIALAPAAIPFSILLAVLLGICDLIRAISLPFRSWPVPPLEADEEHTRGAPHEVAAVSIVMLNWNGRALLEESLPQLQKTLRGSAVKHEVILVDNGSSDDSVDYVKRQFPEFRVLALPENLGFGAGNNAGVRAAQHPYILLLNNDMLVQECFLEPLVECMNSETFAASSQVFFPEGVKREETGKTAARFRHGLLELSHQEITPADERNKVVNVFWGGGGASLYRRDLFLKLGGFDSLFSPSYAEDADLSFRAWKMGYRCVLAPASRVIHKHRSSSRKRFGETGVQNLMHRNIRLFLLRNFSFITLCRYLAMLPANSLAAGELAILARTLPRWPLLFLRRAGRPRGSLADSRILLKAGAPAALPRGEPRPLRILYLSAYVPHLWRHGGAGRVFQLLSRVARVHEVSVATFYENDFELQECEKLRQFCRYLVPVYRRGRPPANIFPYEPFEEFDLPDMRQALDWLRRETTFDIVHFEYTQMGVYADLFPDSRKFLTEIEVNYGAAYSKVALTTNPARRLKWYYNSLQVLDRELALCRKADHIVCVNQTDAELLHGYLPKDRVHVVHTGVDVHHFNLNGHRSEEANSIGFVGAFRHEPNVDAALFFTREIFPLIKADNPRAQFYLIGSSPPDEIKLLHNGTDIHVTGFVEDLLDYYHRMSVIVVPLRTGVGIRGKILEAWASGKPVVGTALAAAGIEARQGENMYIADSPTELAQWTLRLLDNRPARRLMALEGRKTAEDHYDWDKLAQKLCGLYEDAVR